MNTRPVRLAPCAAGREPGDQHPGPRIAEARDRSAPVVSSRNDGPLLHRDLLAPLDQARARAAVDDLAVERAERVARAWPLSVRVGFAAVRVLLMVNPTASSVTARARVDGRDACCAARTTVDVVGDDAARSRRRRWRATRSRRGLRRRRGARRRRHAERSRRRARRHRDRAGAAARRLDQRVRPHARHRLRPDRRGPRSCVDALGARSFAAHRPRRRGRARRTGRVTSCSTSASGFDAAVIRADGARSSAEAATSRTRRSRSTTSTPGSATTTATRTALRRCRATGGDGGRRRARYAVVSNSDPYTYVGRRPLHIAPGASLDAALTVTVLRTLRGRGRRARGRRRGRPDRPTCTTSPEIVQRADVAR